MIEEKDNFTKYAKNFMRRVTTNGNESSLSSLFRKNTKSEIKSMSQHSFNTSAYKPINHKNSINFSKIIKINVRSSSTAKKVQLDNNNIKINNNNNDYDYDSNSNSNKNKIRMDRFGNMIRKGSKTHKVSFKDVVDDEDDLVDEIGVQAFKIYGGDLDDIGENDGECRELQNNKLNYYDIGKKSKNSCACCIMF
jgi:hypothetical protein